MSIEQTREWDERIAQKGRQEFADMEIGDVRDLPVGSLRSSQTDDKLRSTSKVPAEVAETPLGPLVIHGNHRYFTALGKGVRTKLPVRKVQSPYRA